MRGWWAKLLGNRGERAAVRFLRKRGFRILSRGHRTPMGEIDIIAKDDSWIVFVEVKTRKNTASGDPAEAVTLEKQRQITRLAAAWLKKKRLRDFRCRFDVIAITWPDDAKDPKIVYYPHAFDAAGL